ncbi:hypothetical protein AgCh_006230 [Apium graveolens]
MRKMVIKKNPNKRVLSSTTLRSWRSFVTGGGLVRGASLYKRLSALGYNGATVEDTMINYVNDGNFPTKFQIDSCVKELRKYGHYPLALPVMEWMMNKSGIGFAPTDIAKYLDLTAKVEGISAAEYYFAKIYVWSSA